MANQRLSQILYGELNAEEQIIEQHSQFMGEILKNCFARSRYWEYEKTLGHGAFGIAVLLRDRDPLRLRRRRRVVMKRSLLINHPNPWMADADLLNEIEYLKIMRGHSHFAQMLTYTEEVNAQDYTFNAPVHKESVFVRARRRLRYTLRGPPTVSAFEPINRMTGAALLLEYVENGNLLKIHYNQKYHNINLPNRLLWRLYLCLIRACIGLAYPKYGADGEPVVLETLPPRYMPQSRFVHGDIAFRNVMVGEKDLNIPEHRLTPQLKLIDFGNTREVGTEKDAEIYNMFSMNRIMLWLISKNLHDPAPEFVQLWKGYYTYAYMILPHPETGHEGLTHLDPELRDLIANGMACEPHLRPPLREMLRRAQAGAAKPASSYPRGNLEEADWVIDGVLQQILYDAPDAPEGLDGPDGSDEPEEP